MEKVKEEEGELTVLEIGVKGGNGVEKLLKEKVVKYERMRLVRIPYFCPKNFIV